MLSITLVTVKGELEVFEEEIQLKKKKNLENLCFS